MVYYSVYIDPYTPLEAIGLFIICDEWLKGLSYEKLD